MDEGASQLVPKWLAWLGVALTLIGIAAAIYLTVAHYTTAQTLACPETGVINCAKVTTSVYAEILGVPLAVLGLVFFIVMLPLQLPALWRNRSKAVIWGRLAFAVSGVLMVFWLVYVEFFKLNAICLYCTVVHVVTIALFVLTAYGTAALVED